MAGKTPHAGLVRYDKNENVTPYLADSWDIAPDGLTYTFHLNKSAKWQNDRPIVASDLVKGWERYLDPAVAAQAGADYLGNIVGASARHQRHLKSLTGAVAVDDKTLKISLEKVDPIFLLRLASSVHLGRPQRGGHRRQAAVEGQTGRSRAVQVRRVEGQPEHCAGGLGRLLHG